MASSEWLKNIIALLLLLGFAWWFFHEYDNEYSDLKFKYDHRIYEPFGLFYVNQSVVDAGLSLENATAESVMCLTGRPLHVDGYFWGVHGGHEEYVADVCAGKPGVIGSLHNHPNGICTRSVGDIVASVDSGESVFGIVCGKGLIFFYGVDSDVPLRIVTY